MAMPSAVLMPSIGAPRGGAWGRGVILGPSPLAALRLFRLPLRRGRGPAGGRQRGLALGGLLLGLLGAGVLPAQSTSQTAYPGIPELPTDTGPLAHGWHDFSRYRWGGPLDMCAVAVKAATQRVWRRRDLDTALASLSTRVGTPPAALQIAERCGVAQLLPAAVQQVSRGEGGTAAFIPAYAVALATGRDSATTALLRGYMMHAPTRDAQGRTLLDIWWMDSAMHPVRTALLERDRALAESLAVLPVGSDTAHSIFGATPQAAFVRVLFDAQGWLFNYWLRLGDTAQVRAHAERALTTITKLLQAQITGFDLQAQVAGPFGALLDLALLEHGLHSREVVEVLTRKTRFILHDSTVRGQVPSELLFLAKPFVWPETPYWYSAAGAPVAPPATGGTSPAAAIVPGKVTLIWDPAEDDHRLLAESWQAFSGERLAHIVGMLHRIMDKYGPEGLQLVVLEHTRGMAHGLGAVEPAQEAPAIRQLYQEQFGLPAAVVVDTVRYRVLPDGRRNDAYTPWEKRYIDFTVPEYRPCTPIGDCYPQEAMLLDKHGTIQAFGDRIPWIRGANEDLLLEMFIQKLLKEP